MKCEDVQLRLSTWSNESHSPKETARIESHLESCRECRAFREDVARMEGLAGDLNRPSSPVPLSVPIPRRTIRSNRRWIPALAAGLAILAVVAVNTRSQPAYGAMTKLRQALRKVDAAHVLLRWQRTEGGPIQTIEETWYDRGRWRRTAAPDMGGDRIFLTAPDGHIEFYRYSPKLGRVEHMPEVGNQTLSLTIESFAPSVLPDGAKTAVKDLGPATWKNRRAELVDVLTDDGTERVRFWLDPETWLPIHVEKANKEFHADWKVSGTVDFDFADSWPSEKFDPKVLENPAPRP